MDDPTRCLCRTWNQHKYYLPKHSSLPELQLVVKERSLFHCRQCGRTNSLISPICLWCAWTCKEEKHEFKNSTPRARHTSSPPWLSIPVALSGKFALLPDHANIDSHPLAVPSIRTETNAKPSVIDPSLIVRSISSHMPVHQSLIDATGLYHRCINPHRDGIHDVDVNNLTRELRLVPEGFGEVTIPMHSSSTDTPLFSQTCMVEQVVDNHQESSSARTETESLTHTADASWTISEKMSTTHLRLESVDRSCSGFTTTVKPRLKVSRGVFSVSSADKMPVSHLDDTHEYACLNPDEMMSPPINSAPSPKHQHLRPLRRKNHLQIMPSHPTSDTSEPIAISLTLHHSSPASSHLGTKTSQRLTDYISPHPHTRSQSHPQAIIASISSGTSDPMTPTHQRSLPSSDSSKVRSADTAGSSNSDLSPVRLGHPSRPYYNAIRKNGISPRPSRIRPQSQPPPSSFYLGFDLTPAAVTPESTTTKTTNTSRHLSMSAMLPSPPTLSAFTLNDDDDDDGDDDNGDFEVHSEPTNSARLSLSSSLHRLSYNSHTQTHAHHQSLHNRSNGIGFSMSGETELRMALATSSPSGIATLGRGMEDGFRFRETVIPSENITEVDFANAPGTDSWSVRSKDSFMGRVRRLRKGLKEMLMNKNMTTAQLSRHDG